MTTRKQRADKAPKTNAPLNAAPPQLEHVAIDELLKIVHGGNPKTHDVPSLWHSILRFGFTVPLIVDAITGVLTAGHGRLKGAVELEKMWRGIPTPTDDQRKDGWLGAGRAPQGIVVFGDGRWALPIIRHTFATDDERDAYVIADNRIPESGGFDMDKLRKMLVRTDTTKIASIGFSPESFNRMLSGFTLPTGGAKRGGKARSGPGLTYKVIVTCDDEQQHAKLMDRLEAEGFKVAPMIS